MIKDVYFLARHHPYDEPGAPSKLLEELAEDPPRGPLRPGDNLAAQPEDAVTMPYQPRGALLSRE
jgi:hypothetical protein